MPVFLCMLVSLMHWAWPVHVGVAACWCMLHFAERGAQMAEKCYGIMDE